MKSHTIILKILHVTLFRKFDLTFRWPPVTFKVVGKLPVILKIVPKAGHGIYTFYTEHWRTLTDDGEGTEQIL